MLYLIAGLFTIASAIGLAIVLIVDAYNFVYGGDDDALQE